MTSFHAAAALAAALLIAPAAAQDARPVRSQAVAHADLDLADARDIRRLDMRIARTARALCGEVSQNDLAGRRAAERCADAAVAQAAVTRAWAIETASATMVAGR